MNEPSNSASDTTETTKAKAARIDRWVITVAVAKGIVGLTGFMAALVAIFAWLPLARDSLDPTLKEYETLKALYAGASVSFFDAKLGPPSIVKPVPLERGMMERLYVKKDYVVETVATPEGKTTLFSVLSCSRSFKPTFPTQAGTPITLQDKPLAALMPGRTPAMLFYRVPGTGGPAFFFEMITDAMGASGYRGSGYGVNGRCENLPSHDVDDFAGSVADAPQGITEYRATTPANFYVETWERSIQGNDREIEAFHMVTPDPGDLPPGWPERTK